MVAILPMLQQRGIFRENKNKFGLLYAELIHCQASINFKLMDVAVLDA